jgi:hypothetical protein
MIVFSVVLIYESVSLIFVVDSLYNFLINFIRQLFLIVIKTIVFIDNVTITFWDGWTRDEIFLFVNNKG